MFVEVTGEKLVGETFCSPHPEWVNIAKSVIKANKQNFLKKFGGTPELTNQRMSDWLKKLDSKRGKSKTG